MYIFKNLFQWIHKGQSLWFLKIPLLIALYLLKHLPPDTAWGMSKFRLTGIVCEILGLWTVFLSISDERKKYGHKGYCKFLTSWCAELLSIFKKSHITLYAPAIASSTTIFPPTITHNKNNPTTIEEQIQHILEEIERIKKITEKSNAEIVRVNSTLSNEIDELKIRTNSMITKIENKLKQKATGDYYLLASGLLLTALGMLMTNIPDQIYKLLGFTIPT
jgi:hypothetical protein